MQIPNGNDLSYKAHHDIACFLAAAHRTMLKWLKEVQKRERFDGLHLHGWWYDTMERSEGREQRHRFFSEVMEQVNAVSRYLFTFRKLTCHSQMKRSVDIMEESPNPNDSAFRRGHGIETKSELFYRKADEAVQDLMTFLADFHPGRHPLCVTYFDEAHELGARFWVLLRLLNNQRVGTMMWYIFMGTKSSISYFAPPLGLCESSSLARALISFKDKVNSLRLQKEIQELLGPYIALDFDQNLLTDRKEVTVTIGWLQSLQRFANYGRPL